MLLLAGTVSSSPVRAEDPDVNDIMGALDEASANLDIAWLETLVDHGQFDAALEAENAAMASAERLGGEQRTAAIARTHAWIARAHLAKGELDAAAQAYRRALDVMEPSPSARRELEADAWVGIGWVALCKGETESSLKHFANAHTALEKQGRAGSAAEVPQLLGTARAHLAAGNKPKAQEAVRLAQQFGGPANEGSTLRVQVLIDLADANAESAEKTLRRLHEIENGDHILREMAGMPFERHNLSMLDRLMSDLHLSLTVTAMTNGREAETRKLAFTSLLRRKGLVLEVVAARRAAIRKLALTDPGLADRVKQLSAIESELATLERQPPTAAERAAHAKRISELVESADHRQMAINLHLPVGGGAADVVKQSNAVTIESVQQALPADAALVEIVRYRPAQGNAKTEVTRWGNARYAAFVLKHQGEPAYFDLGDANTIERSVTDFRQSLSEQRDDVQTQSRKLEALIMAPVRASLEGIRRLWIAPDRALHTVPFEALVDEAGHYLVEQFGMTYLGTGRELTRPRAPKAETGKPVILANPTYARAAGTAPAQADVTRAIDFRKAHFSPLPGTAEEAEGIRKALPNATVVMGEAATRDVLLSLVKPSLLHVATHGFYLAQETPDKKDGGAQRGLELQIEPAKENNADEPASADPLLRSGLALAGADGGGGIVSALELSSIDLSGTKLAVLSACETGLGDLMSGEGVFGLRRALVIAGAEAQIVSLWQVDDEATRTMMVEYYTKLMAGGGRSESMRATRLAMMRNPKMAHPFFWASFLVSGDATTLEGADAPSTPVTIPKPPTVSPGARGCSCELAAMADDAHGLSVVAGLSLGTIALRRRRISRRQRAK